MDKVPVQSNITFFLPPDPIRNQGYLDTLQHTRPSNDPESPPPKKPGEALIVRTAIVCLLVGGLIGFFLGFQLGTGIAVACTFAGIFIGCIAGAFLGEALNNRHLRHQP